MKRQTKTGLGLGLAALALMPMLSSVPVSAWGPQRPTYTMEKPADHAVFNSITDNAAVGNELNFVRVAQKNAGESYRDYVDVEAGKEYVVFIYFHNDASETLNDEAHDRKGVAWNTRVSSDFPDSLKAGEQGVITGRITSTSTDPAAVWDEAYLTAKEDVTLHYVAASARIRNGFQANDAILSTNLFSSQGTFIGMNELNGTIPGCDRFSGYVKYTILAKAVDKPKGDDPDDPEPEDPIDPPEPEDPEPPIVPIPPEEPEDPKDPIPKELPSTGPAEVVLAVVVVLAIVAGGAYWYKTHKAVKKATKRAKGKK